LKILSLLRGSERQKKPLRLSARRLIAGLSDAKALLRESRSAYWRAVILVKCNCARGFFV
jgi:hypothetical protein